MRRIVTATIAISAAVSFLTLAGAALASGQSQFLYVSDPNVSTVTVIDPSTGSTVTTIHVDGYPEGEVTNGTYVYVADINGHSISVISTASNTVVDSIPIGGDPNRLALSPDGSRLYAGDTGPDSQISVIDTATNTVIRTLPGFAEVQGLAVSPDGTLLYAVNTNYSNLQGSVSVISTADYSTIATIAVQSAPDDIVLTPDGSRAYVTNGGGADQSQVLNGSVSVIDTATDTVIDTITVDHDPFGITMSPDGSRVYVVNSNYRNGGVQLQTLGVISVIDTATNTVIDAIPVGYIPQLITFSPDGTMIYVADSFGNSVSVIDPATDTVAATFNAGQNAYGVTLAPAQSTPAPQMIDFAGPGSGVYGGQAALTASGGGSGNLVTFTLDNSGTAGACAVSGASGSTVSYTGAGSCVIDANQAGGNGYAAAAQVQQIIEVNPAPLTITASSPAMTYGSAVPAITASYSGLASSDGPGSLTTRPTCSTTAASSSPAGTYPATCTGAADLDYAISYTGGTVTVTPATPPVSWPSPGTISYGTPLGPAQLDATAPVPGTFAYSPPAGTVLQPGAQTLAVTFTPQDTTDYTNAAGTATIMVGFTQPCLTTTHSGSLTVAAGQSLCIGTGGKVTGSVTIGAGGALWVSGGTIGGSLTATRALAITTCAAQLTGSVTLTSTAGPVVLGGSGCSASTFRSSLTITASTAGVQLAGSQVSGSLTLTGNSGGLAATGNTISGSAKVTLNTSGVTFTDNTITGSLVITGNTGGFTYTGNTTGGSLTNTGNS